MQPSTSQDALSQLQQFQGSLQTPQAALEAAKQTLNVGGAQQTATGLQGAIQNTTNLLNHVAPSVYGRTGNSLVTSAQAGKQIENESAPLQATLSQQGTDYGNAEKNYEDLLGQAEQQSNASLTQQGQKMSSLQDIYNDLYTKEKNTSDAAEAKREFDASLAETAAGRKAAASGGGLSGLGSLLSGAGAPAAVTPQLQQRADKGFNFNVGGKGISAAQYSQMTGTPLRTLLQNMAKSGDGGAKLALDYVGNDYGVNAKKVGNNAKVKAVLNSILSGVNKIK